MDSPSSLVTAVTSAQGTGLGCCEPEPAAGLPRGREVYLPDREELARLSEGQPSRGRGGCMAEAREQKKSFRARAEAGRESGCWVGVGAGQVLF